MPTWFESKRERAKTFYERHEKYWPPLFFIGGFLFDLFMLDRIDSPEVILQQLAYIVLVGFILGQMLYEQRNPVQTAKLGWLKRQYYHHRTEVMHFFLGTLLNAYTIFFFKSSSLVVSFGFLLFLVGLMIVNEMPRFRSMELSFKFALLSLCSYCFCSYVLPIFVGSMNGTLFFFSLLVGYLPFVMAGWWVQRRSQVFFEMMKTEVLLPSTLVLFVFLLAYMARMIPPAPLSIPYIGVYHSVDKTMNGYKLGHQKPWWKFWQSGDQDFVAQPGDKIFVFFRIFSPTRFADQVMLAWHHKDPVHGWREEDRIPIHIVGGRREGFRGYGFKANYEPGEWRAEVETNDGREIGRISFVLALSPSQLRNFIYDTQ